jgi:hypothetical protein
MAIGSDVQASDVPPLHLAKGSHKPLQLKMVHQPSSDTYVTNNS